MPFFRDEILRFTNCWLRINERIMRRRVNLCDVLTERRQNQALHVYVVNEVDAEVGKRRGERDGRLIKRIINRTGAHFDQVAKRRERRRDRARRQHHHDRVNVGETSLN